MRDDLGKRQGLFPQVHFVHCEFLVQDFMPSVTNICIQFTRHAYFYWMSHIAIEPNVMKYYADCCLQCTVNLDMNLFLTFMFSQIWSTVPAWKLGLNWSVLRKFRERAFLLICSIGLLTFVYMLFWSHYLEVSLTWIIAFFLSSVYKSTLKLK